MRLLVLGVSHHTAPIDLRERLAFATGDLGEAVSTLARDPALGEVVLLSTCNRTELYATCQSLEDGREAMAGFLTAARAVPADDLRAHIYTRSEADAARHLFRVAAGLDSLVVGEPQILGQVEAGLRLRHRSPRTGALLNRLFHTAFTAGKRVRAETGWPRARCRSATRRSAWRGRSSATCTRVGAGDWRRRDGRADGAALRRAAAEADHHRSRTAAHAEALAADVGGAAVPGASSTPRSPRPTSSSPPPARRRRS